MKSSTPIGPTVKPQNGVSRLAEAIESGRQLLDVRPFNSVNHDIWAHRAADHLTVCFGSDDANTRLFLVKCPVEARPGQYPGRSKEESLSIRLLVLEDCRKELERRAQEEDEDSEGAGTNRLDLVTQVLRRFPVAAKALASRPRQEKKIQGYLIADEYDVQDLLFAILKPLIPDLDREDPIQKTAGDSGRADLVSQKLGLLIEVKYGKNPKRADDFARECRERIPIYSKWPGLRTLIFFIYDPNGYLEDPDNFIEGFRSRDTSWDGKSFGVMALVSPHAS